MISLANNYVVHTDWDPQQSTAIEEEDTKFSED